MGSIPIIPACRAFIPDRKGKQTQKRIEKIISAKQRRLIHKQVNKSAKIHRYNEHGKKDNKQSQVDHEQWSAENNKILHTDGRQPDTTDLGFID